MLATSKYVLFPSHNYLLTTSTDDPSLAGARAIIKVSGHQYRWLAGGYELKRTFLEVASMVVTWWMVALCAVCNKQILLKITDETLHKVFVKSFKT